MTDLPPSTYFAGIIALYFVVFTICSFCIGSLRSQVKPRGLLAIGPCVSVFALILFIGVFISERSKAGTRSEVRTRIASVLSSEPQVRINGQEIANPDLLLQTLCRMHGVDANHSGPRPEANFVVTIATADDEIEVRLVQDRRSPDEYWVYFKSDSSSSSDAISRIKLIDAHYLGREQAAVQSH